MTRAISADPELFDDSVLVGFASAVLQRSGLSVQQSAAVAHGLVEANLRGIDGHGVLRLRQYVKSIRGNGINVAAEPKLLRRSGATAVIDAEGGYGFLAAEIAMNEAIDLAREFGAGLAGVKNSHHFGMASLYAVQAARAGMIGLATTNTTPVLPAPGGARPLVGNNPISIAVPRRADDVIVADLALSEASWGKVSLAAAAGEPIPVGWAFDAAGAPTTDASIALESNLLAPVGGAKGFALAVLLELLAGALTGSPVGLAADGHSIKSGGCGHLLIAIDPDRFAGRDTFERLTEELVGVLQSSTAGAGVRLPGSRSHEQRRQRAGAGVPLSRSVLDELDALADSLGLPRLVQE